MKVKIYKSDFNFHSGFWIYYEQNGKRYVAKPVDLEFEELGEYSPSQRPTITLSGSNSSELFESMVEELNRAGVKSPAKEKVFGLYEAQSEHLQDLRHLLKLDVKK